MQHERPATLTGWHRDVDEYGRDLAVDPDGHEMPLLEAKRWLNDVAEDLGLSRPGAEQATRRPERGRERGKTMGRNQGRGRGSDDPTQKQLALIERLGGDPGSVFSKQEASDLIDELAPPATDKQIEFLESLGYDFPNGDPNKFEASKLIDELKAQNEAA